MQGAVANRVSGITQETVRISVTDLQTRSQVITSQGQVRIHCHKTISIFDSDQNGSSPVAFEQRANVQLQAVH